MLNYSSLADRTDIIGIRFATVNHHPDAFYQPGILTTLAMDLTHLNAFGPCTGSLSLVSSPVFAVVFLNSGNVSMNWALAIC